MGADTRIKADTIDNLLGVQPLHLGIGIKFVEVADTQSQVGVSEQLNCLCLSKAHKQSVNVLFNCAFLQEFCKSVCRLYQSRIVNIRTNNDTGRIKVVVQSLALTQKFRAKNNVVAVEFFTNTCCITNRDGALDNHDSFWIIFNDQLNYSFHCRGIKEIFLAIVVCRSSNYYKISITVCFLSIQSCSQIQFFFCQILFNVFILNRGFFVVDKFNFLRDDIHSIHLMVLR